MANIRIKDLPKATPTLSSDYFVFEKSVGGGNFTTSTDLLTAITGSPGSQGIQGIQGTGSQGAQGIQGTGNQGLQGAQGLQGRQGLQGLSNQGAQGTLGSQGNQGSQGTSGNSGNQGSQGTLGNQGNQGILGSQGTLGNQGNQGVQGLSNQGVQGATSSQGNQGLQGVGSQGGQGLQGIQGVPGAAANQGTQGTQGLQGLQGVGTQGAQGMQGFLGLQGNQGLQGLQGAQGMQGVQGLSNQGAQGTLGSQGTFGTQGNQGIQGLANQGAQGLFGNQGLQGLSNQGAQGLSNQGLQGTQGVQGLSNQGAQGISNQGVQGLSNQGVQGSIGSIGATGAPGQSTSFYPYLADTTATSTPPPSGDLRWDNAVQANATAIHVSHLNSDGVDIDIFLALLKQNDTLIIQDRNNSANFQRWTISGTPTVVDNSYVSFPVTAVSVAYSFSNNDSLILAITTAGAQGVAGNQGAQGLSNQGVQGLQGLQGDLGSQGSQGIQGISNQGVQGLQGLQGDLGSQGSQGIQGISNQGVQGLLGTTFDYTEVTSNITLNSNGGYIFNTASGALTVTLPSSPTVGQYINITLERNNSNNLTIQRNSSNIGGLAEDLICDVSGTFSLVYVDSTTGWKFIPFSGLTIPTIKLYRATWSNSSTYNNILSGNRIPFDTDDINTDTSVFGGVRNGGILSSSFIQLSAAGYYNITTNIHLYDQTGIKSLYINLYKNEGSSDILIKSISDWVGGADSNVDRTDMIIPGNTLVYLPQPNTKLFLALSHNNNFGPNENSGPYPSDDSFIQGGDNNSPSEIIITKLA